MLASTSSYLARAVSHSTFGSSSSVARSFASPRLVRSLADQPPPPSSTPSPKPKPTPNFGPGWGLGKKKKFHHPLKTPPTIRVKTPGIPIHNLDLNYTFSSIPLFELAERRKAHLALYTPTELDALSPTERSRHTTISNVFHTALRKRDDASRIAYLAQIDHVSQPAEVEETRRQRARKEIGMGKWTEDDAMSWEDYEKKLDEEMRVITEVVERENEAGTKDRVMKLKSLAKRIAGDKKRALMRRQIMKEEKEEKEEKEDGKKEEEP